MFLDTSSNILYAFDMSSSVSSRLTAIRKLLFGGNFSIGKYSAETIASPFRMHCVY